jgi:hypothetical protein
MSDQIFTKQTSGNGNFELVFQDDGNLVLYWKTYARPLWASNTNGRTGARCVLQNDGNLVICDASGAIAWSSNTGGNPGAQLVVTDDGQGYLSTAGGGRTLWQTGTRVSSIDT